MYTRTEHGSWHVSETNQQRYTPKERPGIFSRHGLRVTAWSAHIGKDVRVSATEHLLQHSAQSVIILSPTFASQLPSQQNRNQLALCGSCEGQRSDVFFSGRQQQYYHCHIQFWAGRYTLGLIASSVATVSRSYCHVGGKACTIFHK